MLVTKELLGRYPHPQWITAHTHVILVGFILMMILGVAQWMFPRPSREDQHYNPDLARIIYFAITLATALRTGSEIAQVWSEGAIWRWTTVAGGVTQVLAILLFFYNMWTRIRPTGSQVREAAGEKF